MTAAARAVTPATIGSTTPPAIIDPISDASVSPLDRECVSHRTNRSSADASPVRGSSTSVRSRPRAIEAAAIASEGDEQTDEERPLGLVATERSRETRREVVVVAVEHGEERALRSSARVDSRPDAGGRHTCERVRRHRDVVSPSGRRET